MEELGGAGRSWRKMEEDGGGYLLVILWLKYPSSEFSHHNVTL